MSNLKRREALILGWMGTSAWCAHRANGESPSPTATHSLRSSRITPPERNASSKSFCLVACRTSIPLTRKAGLERDNGKQLKKGRVLTASRWSHAPEAKVDWKSPICFHFCGTRSMNSVSSDRCMETKGITLKRRLVSTPVRWWVRSQESVLGSVTALGRKNPNLP